MPEYEARVRFHSSIAPTRRSYGSKSIGQTFMHYREDGKPCDITFLDDPVEIKPPRTDSELLDELQVSLCSDGVDCGEARCADQRARHLSRILRERRERDKR